MVLFTTNVVISTPLFLIFNGALQLNSHSVLLLNFLFMGHVYCMFSSNKVQIRSL